jgi:hypothetical protein
MGNVLAASSPPAGPPPPAPSLVGLPPPPPSPPGFTLPPLGGGLGAGASAGRGSERTPGAAAGSAAGAADDGACGCLPNPGTFEECHRKCKGEGRGAGRGLRGPRSRGAGEDLGDPGNWRAPLESSGGELGVDVGVEWWKAGRGLQSYGI